MESPISHLVKVAALAGVGAMTAITPPSPRGDAQSTRHKRYRPSRRASVGDSSSLKKLMRAARCGTIPGERMRIIKEAEENAAIKPERYMHAAARRRYLAAKAAFEATAVKPKRKSRAKAKTVAA